MENIESILAISGKFKDAGMTPHIHKSYSIGLFYEGEYHYKHGNKKATLTRGQTRIISPYEVHETYSGEWSYIHFDLNSHLINSYLSDIHQKPIEGIVKLNPLYDNPKIFTLGKKLFCSLDKNLLEQEYALNSFLDSLLRQNSNINILKINYSKKDLARALDYILKNFYRNTLSIEEIANVCALSTFYFARSFKKYFGITVHQYIISLRIEKVKYLVHTSAMSLSQISYECGFSDQSHMIRIFKKIVGKTPTSIDIHWTKKYLSTLTR